MQPDEAFGVYVHIPFCAKRCDYCAFATFTDRDHLQSVYVDAVCEELKRAVGHGMAPASSVFFGGGTPSRLASAELGRIVAAIPRVPGAEVTVECNPDDVDEARIAVYVEHGVNRISLGVQSMVPHVLASLGRIHQPDNVRRAISAIQSGGIGSFNMDLIYGAAGETVTDWEATLLAVADLDPPHVSAYALTVEGGTPLAEHPERYPDDDDQADKYEMADRMFAERGLLNYEISNWSRPGHECEHNWLYWRQGNYLGFGSGAHSHIDGHRWWNVRTPDRFIEHINAGDSGRSEGENLATPERAVEALQLLLRTRAGVPLWALDPADLGALIEQRGDRWVLTRSGRLLGNEVSTRLIAR